MSRPLLLDLFCGAGGAAMGYHRAGFDVVGVDHVPQRNYPFDFYRFDALTFLSDHPAIDGQPFDVIHASPPCQAHSNITTFSADRATYPDLIAPTRELLETTGVPWVIENVPGAPLRNWVQICGSGLGMRRIRRHRWFESNTTLLGVPCVHGTNGDLLHVTGHGELGGRGEGWNYKDRRAAMGIEWMAGSELTQAIPPSYTEHLGTQLLAHLRAWA